MASVEYIRVFVGWDSQEPITYQVATHSILKRASGPVAIVPLRKPGLQRYARPRASVEATEFSLTRFLVPYLSGYEGFSIFMDCDMLVNVDIWDVLLHPLAEPGKAVYCCQHDYVPKQATKFEGHVQTTYPRKNWSSFMIFDNAKCKALTPDRVNELSGLDLHRFNWLEGDHQIGSLPLTWNWLVGEYEPNQNANVFHYTNGAPCFQGYEDCDHSDLWWQELDDMMEPVPSIGFRALMADRRRVIERHQRMLSKALLTAK